MPWPVGPATSESSAATLLIAGFMEEAEKISARKATLLNPTEEDETVAILRRRFFQSIDDAGAAEVIQAYRALISRLWAERPAATYALHSHHLDLGYGPLHNEVSAVKPARIKADGAARQARTKTGAVDARLIADFGASQSPSRWTPPPPAQRELRALVACRDALVVMRTQEQNRLPVATPACARASRPSSLI